MAQGFPIFSDLIIKLDPKNVNMVQAQLKQTLSSGSLNIDILKPATLDEFNRAMKRVRSESLGLIGDMQSLGERTTKVFSRFTAYLIASGGILAGISLMKDAVGQALKFNSELIKIKQVSGESNTAIKGLADEVGRLSRNLGVSSSELIKSAVTLKQAGLTVKETSKALEALAQADLAPNFDSMEKTTEGLIAIYQQFGKDIDGVKTKLGSLNAVAGEFAVEASDLITLVQKAGGAAKSSGASFEELLGLFTSVRATTRESADSIATGMRTIFGRLQRPETIKFLDELGIKMRYTSDEAKAAGKNMGDFVGPFEAILRISAGTANMGTGSTLFANLIEQIGGLRQISRVVPLIKESSLAVEAWNVALAGQNSLYINSLQKQDDYLVRLTKIKEQFLEMGRNFIKTEGFESMVQVLGNMAKSAIMLTDALGPLLPYLGQLLVLSTAMGAIKALGTNAAVSLGIRNVQSQRKMATGGIVSGTGYGDKVPTLLEPGEAVIPKAQVSKFPSFINQLISGQVKGFSKGGLVPSFSGTSKADEDTLKKMIAHIVKKSGIDTKNFAFDKLAIFSNEDAMKRGHGGLPASATYNEKNKRIGIAEATIDGGKTRLLSALAHEMGHSADAGMGRFTDKVKPEVVKKYLEKDFLYQEAIKAKKPNKDYIDYLSQPHEVFARAFSKEIMSGKKGDVQGLVSEFKGEQVKKSFFGKLAKSLGSIVSEKPTGVAPGFTPLGIGLAGALGGTVPPVPPIPPSTGNFYNNSPQQDPSNFPRNYRGFGGRITKPQGKPSTSVYDVLAGEEIKAQRAKAIQDSMTGVNQTPINSTASLAHHNLSNLHLRNIPPKVMNNGFQGGRPEFNFASDGSVNWTTSPSMNPHANKTFPAPATPRDYMSSGNHGWGGYGVAMSPNKNPDFNKAFPSAPSGFFNPAASPVKKWLDNTNGRFHSWLDNLTGSTRSVNTGLPSVGNNPPSLVSMLTGQNGSGNNVLPRPNFNNINWNGNNFPPNGPNPPGGGGNNPPPNNPPGGGPPNNPPNPPGGGPPNNPFDIDNVAKQTRGARLLGGAASAVGIGVPLALAAGAAYGKEEDQPRYGTAAIGAGIGGQVGSLLGPLGAIAGTAIGGLVGWFISGKDAIEETNKKLQAKKLDKAVTDLGKSLEEISEGRGSVAELADNLEKVRQESLASAIKNTKPGGSVMKNAQDEFQKNAGVNLAAYQRQINEEIKKQAMSGRGLNLQDGEFGSLSRSIVALRQREGKRFTMQDYEKQTELTYKAFAADKARKDADTRYVQSVDNAVHSAKAFADAVQGAADSASDMDKKFAVLLGGGYVSPSFKLGEFGNINQKNLSSLSNMNGGIFSGATSQISGANQIAKYLPEVLSRIIKPGEGANTDSSIAGAFEESFKNIAQSTGEQFDKKILGVLSNKLDSMKTDELFENFKKAPEDFSKKMLEAFEPTLKAAESIGKTLQERDEAYQRGLAQIKEFTAKRNDLFGNRMGQQININDLQQEQYDRSINRRDTIPSVLNARIPFIQEQNRLLGTEGISTDAAAIGQRIAQEKENLRVLQEKATEEARSGSAVKKFADMVLESEKKIINYNVALGNLQKRTEEISRLRGLQGELQSRADGKMSLSRTLNSSSRKELLDLNNDFFTTKALMQFGPQKIRNNYGIDYSADIFKRGMAMLEGPLSKLVVGMTKDKNGRNIPETGKMAADRILKDNPFYAALNTKPEEDKISKILQEITAITTEGKIATDVMLTDLTDAEKRLYDNLAANNNEFFTNVNKLINQLGDNAKAAETGRMRTQLNEMAPDIKNAKDLADSKLDVSTVRKNIKQIREAKEAKTELDNVEMNAEKNAAGAEAFVKERFGKTDNASIAAGLGDFGYLPEEREKVKIILDQMAQKNANNPEIARLERKRKDALMEGDDGLTVSPDVAKYDKMIEEEKKKNVGVILPEFGPRLREIQTETARRNYEEKQRRLAPGMRGAVNLPEGALGFAQSGKSIETVQRESAELQTKIRMNEQAKANGQPPPNPEVPSTMPNHIRQRQSQQAAVPKAAINAASVSFFSYLYS
jgi:hypothetical protein